MGIVYYFLYYRAGPRLVSFGVYQIEVYFRKKNALIQNGIVYLIIVVDFSGGDTILLQETEGFEKGRIMQYL